MSESEKDQVSVSDEGSSKVNDASTNNSLLYSLTDTPPWHLSVMFGIQVNCSNIFTKPQILFEKLKKNIQNIVSVVLYQLKSVSILNTAKFSLAPPEAETYYV